MDIACIAKLQENLAGSDLIVVRTPIEPNLILQSLMASISVS